MRRRKNNNSTVVAGLFLLTTSLILLERGALGAQETARPEAVGKIAGKVLLEGRFKKPARLRVNKNRDFCGAAVPDESLRVGSRGQLQNAVVIVHGASGVKTHKEPKSVILDNKKCAFVPHVQVATVGSEMWLLNSDPILHDAHARLGSETLFNVGLPAWRRVKKRLDREGIVKVKCDVLHTWMSAYVVVTSSPYFSVTDAKGEFVIDRMLPGSYEIQVWHEQLGNQSKRVMVAGNGTLLVDFVYRLGK